MTTLRVSTRCGACCCAPTVCVCGRESPVEYIHTRASLLRTVCRDSSSHSQRESRVSRVCVHSQTLARARLSTAHGLSLHVAALRTLHACSEIWTWSDGRALTKLELLERERVRHIERQSAVCARTRRATMTRAKRVQCCRSTLVWHVTPSGFLGVCVRAGHGDGGVAAAAECAQPPSILYISEETWSGSNAVSSGQTSRPAHAALPPAHAVPPPADTPLAGGQSGATATPPPPGRAGT